jgi:hypothetical protein
LKIILKPIVIFAVVFIGILVFSGIPNFVEAQSTESVCKATSNDYVQGQGYVLNQEEYEECVDRSEKQDMWRSIKQWGVGIFILIVIGGIGIIVVKNLKTGAYNTQNYNTSDTSYSIPVVRRGWTVEEKEQVRLRQDGKCVHCGKPPPRWEYHHSDGDRSNNSLSNCIGLCPNCHSVETHEG